MTVGTSYDLSTLGSNSSTTTKNTNSTSNDSLDKDAFLKLLITQFQYQDPLDPVDDKEFIAQMAQFTSLEQMTNLNTSMESMLDYMDNMNVSMVETQVLGYIGKGVTAVDSETKTAFTGKVSGVALIEGSYQLTITDVKDSSGNAVLDSSGKPVVKNIAVSDVVEVTAGD